MAHRKDCAAQEPSAPVTTAVTGSEQAAAASEYNSPVSSKELHNRALCADTRMRLIPRNVGCTLRAVDAEVESGDNPMIAVCGLAGGGSNLAVRKHFKALGPLEICCRLEVDTHLLQLSDVWTPLYWIVGITQIHSIRQKKSIVTRLCACRVLGVGQSEWVVKYKQPEDASNCLLIGEFLTMTIGKTKVTVQPANSAQTAAACEYTTPVSSQIVHDRSRGGP